MYNVQQTNKPTLTDESNEIFKERARCEEYLYAWRIVLIDQAIHVLLQKLSAFLDREDATEESFDFALEFWEDKLVGAFLGSRSRPLIDR